jgi:hypothetical protein
MPIDPTGVAIPNPLLPPTSKGPPLANCIEPIIIQTLEGNILPLLPAAPLLIHNMQFKTRVSPECYAELDLPHYKKNYGKHHIEIIGNTHVDYILYSNGTVNVITTCSNNPHRLETEEDRSRLLTFLGQIRDRLIVLLCDKHERIVPDIMDWQLTECDINKDVKVSDLFHLSAIKMQVMHLDHLFRIYIKSMGKDTVCRIEETKLPKKEVSAAVEAINNIFNPIEHLENLLEDINRKLDKIGCTNNCKDPSAHQDL